METKTKKILGYGIAGCALAVVAVGAAYVMFNTPDKVKTPCWRTFHRKDRKPKMAFKSAARANFQSLTQLVLHGEVCNSYEANGKFYTGHSKYAAIKNIRVA